MQNKMSRDKCEHVCMRAYMLCCRCVCVCLREARSAGGHLKSNGTLFDLAALLSLHSGVLSAAACQECAQAACPSFLPGHCSLHNPNNNNNSPTLTQTQFTHTSKLLSQTEVLQEHTHTHTHTQRTRNILFCLMMMIDADPPPNKKNKKNALQQSKWWSAP